MSPKELLYIEDALEHGQQLKNLCSTYASQLQTPELKTLVEKLTQENEKSFTQFFNLLNN